MGNLQTLYVKFPESVPQWWAECKDDIFVPRVDGKFVLTRVDPGMSHYSVNLKSILTHWEDLRDVTWVVREWQCNPCGTGVDWSKVPEPRERTIPAEEAKALIVSANRRCPWCNGPLDGLLDGGSYQCQPCGRTFHHCMKGLPNTETKKGQVYCVNGSGPLECECRKIKIELAKSRKSKGTKA